MTKKIPDDNSDWEEICDYALSFNGHRYIQSLIDDDMVPNYISDIRDRKNVMEIFFGVFNLPKLILYKETGINDFTIDELRAELFLRQRGARWEGHGPDSEDIETARELIKLIKELYERSNLVS